MTVIGLDDTDSRERGMCTTYVAARLAEDVREAGGTVERLLLVRLNPAVEHKTRGNAALAVHADVAPDLAFALACDRVESLAERADDRTAPGVVVAGDPPADDSWRAGVARRALHEVLDHEAVADRLAAADARYASWGAGRGLVGATAAVGAWAAFEEWTYERISYRRRDRWGTPRDVDADSVFAAADDGYPAVWDTVDRGTGEVVCVPRTPCPVLHGVRGDDVETVTAVAAAIESEPAERAATFVTNQGTDAHLRDVPPAEATDRTGVRFDGVVAGEPETRRGGHTFVPFDAGVTPTPTDDDADGRVRLAAFEPTKRFRDHVRSLRPGDRLTVCGELDDGTVKLEKFAVREPVETESGTPACPDCERRMESAGRDQGYRCRGCGTSAPGPVERPLDRSLSVGWYEVPPRARRHVARPLVRGGFDAPTHPER